MHQAGAVSFALCAVSFVVGLITLYAAEGPNAPDLWVYLASPSGRSDLSLSTLALTAAIVLLFVGIAVMSMSLAPGSGAAGRLARYLAAIAAAAFIGFLSLQYALVAVLDEGIDPASQQFKVLVLQQHAATDWAGWTGIVLLGLSLLLLGSALVREAGRRVTGWSAIAAGAVGLILIPIGFGFLFTMVAAIWAIVAAIDLVRAGRASGRT
jgi:hypothetical protein